METWDAIRSRRNVRRFAADPVPPGDLDRILQAGRRAPSSMNEQPWEFVVCTERETLAALSRTWRHAGHVAGSAATVVLVAPLVSDPDTRDWLYYDMGQATMSMMLAAADVGVGSCHAALDDQALARRVLQLPDDRFCVGMISLGYPVGRPLTPLADHDRRPFSEVVRRERWTT